MRPLTIVQMLPELNVGGVEEGVLDASREYVKRGHRSVVISAGGRQVPQLEAEGAEHVTLPVHRKRPVNALRMVPRVARVLTDVGADVVHARSRVPAWIGWYAARRAGVPFVTTVHGFYSVNFYSRIMVRGERVIAVSRAVAEYAQRDLGADPATLRVIFRGTEPERFDLRWKAARVTDYRRELGIPEKGPVVAIIGRITRLKGHPVYLRAMAGVLARQGNAVPLIVGAVPPKKKAYEAELRALTARLGLTGTACFVGVRRDLPELLQACDVVVNCSTRPESFGRTLIEAMAAGVPVVATAHGGALDIVEDGVCGHLVPPDRPEPLAEALCGLLADPKRARAMGAAGRKRVRKHFTLDRMVDETVAVYREVAG